MFSGPLSLRAYVPEIKKKNKKKKKKKNYNRPTFLNNISGIIITDVADHFGTFHIVSKCKQTPVQTYS